MNDFKWCILCLTYKLSSSFHQVKRVLGVNWC